MSFLPPVVESHVLAAERGRVNPVARRGVLAVLLPHYTGARWLLVGAALWAGVVGTVLLAAFGAVAVLGVLVAAEPWPWLLVGAGVLLVVATGGTWVVRRALELLRDGGRLGRAVETWLRSGPPAPDSVTARLHGLLSALRPELFPRAILGSLNGLATVLLASAVGFAGTRLAEPGRTAVDVASLVVLGTTGALLAVVCGVVTVALWRGARRVQRGLLHAPSAGG